MVTAKCVRRYKAFVHKIYTQGSFKAHGYHGNQKDAPRVKSKYVSSYAQTESKSHTEENSVLHIYSFTRV